VSFPKRENRLGGTEKHAFRQELFNGLILHANN